MYTAEIHDSNTTSLIGFAHQGDYLEIGEKFEKLFSYAGENGLMNENTRSIGLYYDDPQSVDANKLRSAACITDNTGHKFLEETGLQRYTIPESKVVSILFKGPYPELEKVYSWLFGEWLPESGYELANFPAFEEYLNDPNETDPNELLTKVNCLLQS